MIRSGSYDGIGDPSILTDRVTGTIWVAATWSHGNRSWFGSGPGLEPEETGQLMLVKSTDDGLTWSGRSTSHGKSNRIRLAVCAARSRQRDHVGRRHARLPRAVSWRGRPIRSTDKPFSTIIYSTGPRRHLEHRQRCEDRYDRSTNRSARRRLDHDQLPRQSRRLAQRLYTTKDLGKNLAGTSDVAQGTARTGL